MHKDSFEGLKHTFMHVSGLAPPYFAKKQLVYKFVFIIK